MRFFISLLLSTVSVTSAYSVEFDYSSADVLEKWPSPTPWLQDRFSDFLQLMPKNGVVAEIGVEWGSFSKFILSTTSPKMLYLIDCWESQPEEVYIDPDNLSTGEQEKLYNHVMSSFRDQHNVNIIREYSHKAVERFPDEFFDWVYIDANHGYKTAKEDIEMWWPKVKKGGYLSGHDYVVRPHFGVVQAINEFLAEKQLYFSFLTMEEGKHDSWAIQKPAD